MTIKRKLLSLTITGLAFVLAISATGYWGISTVEETTAQVAAMGSAIRNHVEAGVYNDMTRIDMSAVFTAKGDTRQNKLDELAQHYRLLKDRIAKTEPIALGSDAASAPGRRVPHGGPIRERWRIFGSGDCTTSF